MSHNIDEGEQTIITFKQAAEMLFGNEPPSPGSIAFQLEEEDGSPLNLSDVSTNLRDLLVMGFCRLFSNATGQVNLCELKDEDFYLLNKYFQGIGFNLNYQVISGIRMDRVERAFNATDKLPDLIDKKSERTKRFQGLDEYVLDINTGGKKFSFYFTPYVYIPPSNTCAGGIQSNDNNGEGGCIS